MTLCWVTLCWLSWHLCSSYLMDAISIFIRFKFFAYQLNSKIDCHFSQKFDNFNWTRRLIFLFILKVEANFNSVVVLRNFWSIWLGARVIKLFTGVIYKCLQKPIVFVLGKPFQPNQMFVRKALAYPSVASKRSSSVLVTNIRLGCKGLPRTNTLALKNIRKLRMKNV